MKYIYTIIIIFATFLALNAQTAEQIKKQIKDTGITLDQAKKMAKDRGVTDQQIEAEAQVRGIDIETATSDESAIQTTIEPKVELELDESAVFEVPETDEMEATDEASMVEALGGKVSVVEGPYSNFKITTKEDWTMAEKFLK